MGTLDLGIASTNAWLCNSQKARLGQRFVPSLNDSLQRHLLNRLIRFGGAQASLCGNWNPFPSLQLNALRYGFDEEDTVGLSAERAGPDGNRSTAAVFEAASGRLVVLFVCYEALLSTSDRGRHPSLC